jgi:hypothetical protein
MEFIRFVERVTGICGLIPDPTDLGAGIHRSPTGGFLNVSPYLSSPPLLIKSPPHRCTQTIPFILSFVFGEESMSFYFSIQSGSQSGVGILSCGIVTSQR